MRDCTGDTGWFLFYCITPAGIVKTNLSAKFMCCDLHASGGPGIQIPDTLPGLR